MTTTVLLDHEPVADGGFLVHALLFSMADVKYMKQMVCSMHRSRGESKKKFRRE